MSSSDKKFYLIVLIIAIILVVVIVVANHKKGNSSTVVKVENSVTDTGEEFTKMDSDGSKVNVSEALNKEHIIDGLKIENIRFSYKNGITTLLADATNTTSSDITDPTLVTVKLLDKSGAVINTINGIISPVKQGETVQLNINTTIDTTNVYDFDIEKNS